MGTPTTAMHKLLLLVAGVSRAPQQQRAQQQASRPAAYGPQGAAARYEKVPVYREEMAKNYPREEIPVYREQEKPLEKRQAAYGPAVVAVEKLPPQPFQYEYGVRTTTAGTRSPRRRHRTTWVRCRAATRSTSQTVVFRLSPTTLIMREALLQRSPMREPHSTLSHLRVDMDPIRDRALPLAPLPLAPTQEGDSDQDAPHYLLSFVNNVNISLE